MSPSSSETRTACGAFPARPLDLQYIGLVDKGFRSKAFIELPLWSQ
jgi:hypothetical protein